jgi:hypothetical protein
LSEVITKDRQILDQLFSAMVAQTDRLDSVENRMVTVELLVDKEVYITSRERKQINKAVKTRVMELLDGDAEYKEKSRKYFSWLWDEVQAKFGVNTYYDIPRKQFNGAMKVICEWTPIRLISKVG